jgi:hypothetical protein
LPHDRQGWLILSRSTQWPTLMNSQLRFALQLAGQRAHLGLFKAGSHQIGLGQLRHVVRLSPCPPHPRDTPDYHVENRRSVYRAGRGLVRELGDGLRDLAPDSRALAIAGFGKGIGPRGAFRLGIVAVALEQ